MAPRCSRWLRLALAAALLGCSSRRANATAPPSMQCVAPVANAAPAYVTGVFLNVAACGVYGCFASCLYGCLLCSVRGPRPHAPSRARLTRHAQDTSLPPLNQVYGAFGGSCQTALAGSVNMTLVTLLVTCMADAMTTIYFCSSELLKQQLLESALQQGAAAAPTCGS